MVNIKSEPTCTGCEAPQKDPERTALRKTPHKHGCMVCGQEIIYSAIPQTHSCHFCGVLVSANAICADGHFVCDACHSADAVAVIVQTCLHSDEPDAVALMQKIRSHPHFRIHGPEHHALVPAVILTALKNSGNEITEQQIMTAIQRGQTIGGGACGLLGACGAAVGVGIALSVLIGANPHNGDKRQAALDGTRRALEKIASYAAPRCCQRDCWSALQVASKLLEEKSGLKLKVDSPIHCGQFQKNKECIRERCPLREKMTLL